MQSLNEQCSERIKAWSELNTVASFDTGSTQRVGSMADSDIVLRDIRPISATSLLVESLIEQLCKLLEKDPAHQKKIYHEICRKLHRMKLIDKTYGVEEFEFMRSHYQKALLHLVTVAKTTVKGARDDMAALIHLSNTNIELTNLLDHNRLDWSRYRTDYVELEYINEGGFGRVFKARNKLDGGEYAVKKIFLRYRNVDYFLRNLREVKMLARLNHPNIVSYKAAWLEPLDRREASDYLRSNIEEQFDSVPPVFPKPARALLIDHEEESQSIVFQHGVLENSNKSFGTSKSVVNSDVNNLSSSEIINFGTSGESSQNHERFESLSQINAMKYTSHKQVSSTDASETSDNRTSSSSNEAGTAKILCKFKQNSLGSHKVWKFDNTITVPQQEWAVLYIQMQLCEQTLGHWLMERNSSRDCVIDIEQCLTIFKQIVLGIHYIHTQNIVHHDIKPSNIFVNYNMTQVQVGDFGLACCFQHSPENVTLISQKKVSPDHKGEIGTRLYAAPEQLRGKCDPKSDIYSLGIVLFELLQPFSTSMERSILITQLKTGNIAQDLMNRAPKLAQLIIEVVTPSLKNRPTAVDLLEKLDVLICEMDADTRRNSLETIKDEEIKHLKEALTQKDKQIEELKIRIQNLESFKKVVNENGYINY